MKWSASGRFWETRVQEHFFFVCVKDPPNPRPSNNTHYPHLLSYIGLPVCQYVIWSVCGFRVGPL